MARLIDATRIEQYILNNCSDNEEINAIYAEIINAPTVDAEPVVRCKDCKWWKTKYMRLGERKVCVIEAYEPVRNEDEYCSWAERKEDAEIH